MLEFIPKMLAGLGQWLSKAARRVFAPTHQPQSQLIVRVGGRHISGVNIQVSTCPPPPDPTPGQDTPPPKLLE